MSCKDSNAAYVGQTKRKLKTRLNKHIKNIRLDSTQVFRHLRTYF